MHKCTNLKNKNKCEKVRISRRKVPYGDKFLMKRYDFSATRWLLVLWITHCSKMRHNGLIHLVVQILHINGTNKFAVPLATPPFGTFNLLKYLLVWQKFNFSLSTQLVPGQ